MLEGAAGTGKSYGLLAYVRNHIWSDWADRVSAIAWTRRRVSRFTVEAMRDARSLNRSLFSHGTLASWIRGECVTYSVQRPSWVEMFDEAIWAPEGGPA